MAPTAPRYVSDDPALCAQYSAKNPLPPTAVLLSSRDASILWDCEAGCDHEWPQSPQSRYQRGRASRCPFCANRLVSITNCLATVAPALAKELDVEAAGKTAYEVLAGSKTLLPWTCPTGIADHRYLESPQKRRTGGKGQTAGQGCPFCANRRLSVSNCLAIVAPELAKEWHPTKNPHGPEHQIAPCKDKRWWLCAACGHEWRAEVGKRVGRKGKPGTGCPRCAGHAVTPETSLAALHPSLMAEWADTTVDPHAIGPGYTLPVDWCCPKCATRWRTSPAKRTRGDMTGCPGCAHQVPTAFYNLATERPAVAERWDARHNEDGPEAVMPGSTQVRVFLCSRCPLSFRHQVGTMTADTVCPRHTVGWTRESVAGLLRAIVDDIPALAPFELWLLFHALGADANRNVDLMAKLSPGSLDLEKVRAFAAGDRDAEAAYRDGRLADFCASDAYEDESEDEPGPAMLPATPSVEEILDAAENVCGLLERHDVELIETFLASAVEKLLRKACTESPAAVAPKLCGVTGRFRSEIAARTRAVIEDAQSLELPSDYTFRNEKGEHITPSLMQRLVATRVRDQRRYGNWSGTGAGKTLSAIIASRILGPKATTIVVCPNNVISGFVKELLAGFPENTAVCLRTFTPDWEDPDLGTADAAYRYLIVNFDRFQAPDAEDEVRTLAAAGFDFAIVDEGHQAKQRFEEHVSTRRRRITDFLAIAAAANEKLAVLVMTATPVINNLFEGRALIEMVTGLEHADLGGRATVGNCVALHAALLRYGFRHEFENPTRLEVRRVAVDASEVRPDLLALGRGASPLPVEAVLTKVRAEKIAELARPGTVVYTHYVDGVVSTIYYALQRAGLSAGLFTGGSKAGLDPFLAGEIDVLILTGAGATGLDGLQSRSNHLVINCLPWTAAERVQLFGRVHRQRQRAKVVHIDVIAAELPIYEGDLLVDTWSYDDDKWSRLESKQMLADAAVDGRLPAEGARSLSPSEATREALALLTSIESQGLCEPGRSPLGPGPAQVREILAKRRERSEFSITNRRWYRRHSSVTHGEVAADPSIWDRYHADFDQLRERWEFDPVEDFLFQIELETKGRHGVRIGDFGCGPHAKVAAAFGHRHDVVSIDHAAGAPAVTVADLAALPCPSNHFEIVGFCLSLQGANAAEYLREARRVLVPGGALHVYEPTRSFANEDEWLAALAELGFAAVESSRLERFTHVVARKATLEGLVDVSELESCADVSEAAR